MAGTIQTRPASREYRSEYERIFGERPLTPVGGGPQWLCTNCWRWFSEVEEPRVTHRCDSREEDCCHAV